MLWIPGPHPHPTDPAPRNDTADLPASINVRMRKTGGCKPKKKPRRAKPFRGGSLIDLRNYFIRIIFLVLLYLPANIL